MLPGIGGQGQRVDEHIVVFFRFIMQVVTTDAEIEGTAEVRGQPEFLVELPGVFV